MPGADASPVLYGGNAPLAIFAREACSRAGVSRFIDMSSAPVQVLATSSAKQQTSPPNSPL